MTAGEFWIGFATIIAVMVGPVLAVWITRIIDERRASKQRKFDIFRTLMRTRKLPIHVDHVGALNLVEVEFVNNGNVINAWKKYLANLSETLPPVEEKDRFDDACKKRDSLLTKLISEIAKVLKIRIEQIDILEGNYIPQGWHDDDWEQRLVRRGLINVLSGKTPIMIQAPQASQRTSPYPPPPDNS